jgi:S1-C subfamily serine protease
MQFQRLVQETPVGRTVELVVSREGKRMTLNAKIDSRDVRSSERRIELPPFDVPGPNQQFYQFRIPDRPDNPRRIGPADRPRLGITVQPLTEQMGEYLGVPGKRGVLVMSVGADSPSVGKIKAGDVIVSIEGKPVENPEDLTRSVRAKSAGQITLKVIRDKKEIPITVNLPGTDEEGFKL